MDESIEVIRKRILTDISEGIMLIGFNGMILYANTTASKILGITEEDMIKGNVTLTEKVVNACIRAKVRQLIYLSTPGVQGFGHRLCAAETAAADDREGHGRCQADGKVFGQDPKVGKS